MTVNTRPSDFLRVAIIDNHSELVAALEDVELYARLKQAQKEVTRCEARATELETALTKAIADEDAEDKQKRKAAIRNFSVVTTMPERSHGPLAAVYSITYEAPAYDFMSGTSEWTKRTASSFQELAPDVYAYMMEFRTDAIPAVIMELAPGNPEQAMERYFTALRRGWVMTS